MGYGGSAFFSQHAFIKPIPNSGGDAYSAAHKICGSPFIIYT